MLSLSSLHVYTQFFHRVCSVFIVVNWKVAWSESRPLRTPYLSELEQGQQFQHEPQLASGNQILWQRDYSEVCEMVSYCFGGLFVCFWSDSNCVTLRWYYSPQLDKAKLVQGISKSLPLGACLFSCNIQLYTAACALRLLKMQVQNKKQTSDSRQPTSQDRRELVL